MQHIVVIPDAPWQEWREYPTHPEALRALETVREQKRRGFVGKTYELSELLEMGCSGMGYGSSSL